MRNLVRPLVTAVIVSMSFAGIALAKNSSHVMPKQIIPQEEKNFSSKSFAVKASDPALSLIADSKLNLNSEQKALQYLNQRKVQNFTFDSSTIASEYVQSDKLATNSGEHVHFNQNFLGVEIFRSASVVNVNKNGQVDFASIAGADLSMKDTDAKNFIKAKLSSKAAIAKATKYLKLKNAPSFVSEKLMIYGMGEKPVLVRAVRIGSSLDRIYDWEVLVNAKTGAIVRAQDKAFKDAPDTVDSVESVVPGTGMVFSPNPILATKGVYGTGGLTDNDGKDSDFLNNLRKSIVLNEVTKGTDGKFTLKGKYAEIVDVEDPKLGLFQGKTADFNCTRGQKCFQATNAYYFITEAMKYVNETLNIPCMPYQYKGGVHFDPQGLNGDDNSHYLSSGGYVAFGEGGIDDAEDHDVVLHELGHGIHDFLTKGHLSQVDGLSEGFGDYWAASFIRGTGVVKRDDPAYFWVFSWDGHNEFWPGRMLNSDKHYPDGLSGEVHNDGEIWSAITLEIWDDLGKTVTDTLVLEALAMTNESASQQDVANAMMKVDANVYQGAHKDALLKHFGNRGYTINLE